MSEVTIYNIPGGYKAIWSYERIQIIINRFADDRRTQSTNALLTVSSIDPQVKGHLHQGRLNLTSTTGKKDLIRALGGANDTVRWSDLVEDFCVKILELHRQGEPVEVIGGQRALSNGVRYRLWPLCPEGMSTIIFGEAGTGKSLLALLAAYSIQSAQPVMGMRPIAGNVLYLDYETCSDIMHERLSSIAAGFQASIPEMDYRFCYHPLAEEVDTLQEIINERSIDFLIVDSLGLACGGDPSDTELAIRMMGALRELKRGALLIDHVAKNGEKPTPFGSVYKPNLARSVWFAKLGDRVDDRHTNVALYHKKVNFGPLRRPMGVQMAFAMQGEMTTRIDFKTFDVLQSGDEELTGALNQADRIAALVSHKALTVKEIASELHLKEGSVRMAINRHAGKFQQIEGKQWGLKAQPQDATNATL